MATLSPKAQRLKALQLLENKILKDDYLPLDYIIDDECRRVFGLPGRPAKSPPYIGWMINTQTTEESTATHISHEGIELIKRYEGCRTNAYLCPANVWTIGYGHTKTAKPGMMISHQEAERLLIEDIKRFENAVKGYVKVPLKQQQFDALVSFTYNVGAEAFRTSTLLKVLNQGQYNRAALQFHRWTRANGSVLPGLVRRRNDEYGLFVDE